MPFEQRAFMGTQKLLDEEGKEVNLEEDEEERANYEQRKLYVGTNRGVILTIDISEFLDEKLVPDDASYLMTNTQFFESPGK